jgi:putative ABC transport system permease protein
MKFWPLLWSNLKRRKARTIFTLLSIVVAFVLFAYLAAVRSRFARASTSPAPTACSRRTRPRSSSRFPSSYRTRSRARRASSRSRTRRGSAGSTRTATRDSRGLPGPVDPSATSRCTRVQGVRRREARLDRGPRRRARRETTAKRYKWKVGDRVPVQGTIYRKKDGSRCGSSTSAGSTPETARWTRRSSSSTTTTSTRRASQGQGIVGWYIVRIAIEDGGCGRQGDRQAVRQLAGRDKTQTEKALAQGFADQIGNIGAIIQWILTAVFFTLLLVTGNTIAQSVRERTGGARRAQDGRLLQ